MLWRNLQFMDLKELDFDGRAIPAVDTVFLLLLNVVCVNS